MEEFIPIIGMLLTLGPLAVLAISFTPIGRALSTRLRGGDTQELKERLSALKDELRAELLAEQMSQLEELHERLDFTERLLTDARNKSRDTDRELHPFERYRCK